MTLSATTKAQDWNFNGNTGVDPSIHMLGTTDNSPIPFRTGDIERMRLTGDNGWLGLNTTAPVSMFNVTDGAVVFDGTTGVNPNYYSILD